MNLLKVVDDILGKAVNPGHLPHLNGLAQEVSANPHDHDLAGIFYDALGDAGIEPRPGHHPMHWDWPSMGMQIRSDQHPLNPLYTAVYHREMSQFQPHLGGADLGLLHRHGVDPRPGLSLLYWQDAGYPSGDWEDPDHPLHHLAEQIEKHNAPIRDAWHAESDEYRDANPHMGLAESRNHWYENVYKPRTLAARG